MIRASAASRSTRDDGQRQLVFIPKCKRKQRDGSRSIKAHVLETFKGLMNNSTQTFPITNHCWPSNQSFRILGLRDLRYASSASKALSLRSLPRPELFDGTLAIVSAVRAQRALQPMRCICSISSDFFQLGMRSENSMRCMSESKASLSGMAARISSLSSGLVSVKQNRSDSLL